MTSSLMIFLILSVANLKPDKNIESNVYDTIVVSFSQRKLVVYDSSYLKIASYPVAIPKKSVKVTLPVYGHVIGTQLNPNWYPTQKLIDYYKKKGVVLPRVIKAGDPLNAMGEGKIIIKFTSGHITPLSRIHGTYQEWLIGKRVSSGCIRMKNSDIKSLIKIIKNKKTSVIYKQ